MKIYTVASENQSRFNEDVFTSLSKAQDEAIRRSKEDTTNLVYIYIYSQDGAFTKNNGALWYDGFEIYAGGVCIRA